MRRSILLLAALAGVSLLAGCGGNRAAAQYRQDPRGFMREVVDCEVSAVSVCDFNSDSLL